MKTKTKLNKKSNTWKYFDDCAICRAMKNTDKSGISLSEKELKEVFQKANKKNSN